MSTHQAPPCRLPPSPKPHWYISDEQNECIHKAHCMATSAEMQRLRAIPAHEQATEQMADAVRPLIVAIEIAGRTYGSVRAHCKRAGMEVDAWPAWAQETPDGEHFTKAACAALVWHCMNAARIDGALSQVEQAKTP